MTMQRTVPTAKSEEKEFSLFVVKIFILFFFFAVQSLSIWDCIWVSAKLHDLRHEQLNYFIHFFFFSFRILLESLLTFGYETNAVKCRNRNMKKTFFFRANNAISIVHLIFFFCSFSVEIFFSLQMRWEKHIVKIWRPPTQRTKNQIMFSEAKCRWRIYVSN